MAESTACVQVLEAFLLVPILEWKVPFMGLTLGSRV